MPLATAKLSDRTCVSIIGILSTRPPLTETDWYTCADEGYITFIQGFYTF
jgi:hypothetical protein